MDNGERREGIENGAVMSRRTFACGIGGFIGLVALGGVGKLLPSDENVLRPPGGQDEAAFLALCLKCDKCRSVCPENCIVQSQLEDGLVSYRAPKIDFHRGYCTFCNECIAVCPTKALAPFDSAADKIGVAVVDESECIAFKRGGCQACVDACGYGAISLTDAGRPVVDAGLCNGCGECEYVCPSASYTSYSGSGRRGINVAPMKAVG